MLLRGRTSGEVEQGGLQQIDGDCRVEMDMKEVLAFS